MKAPESKSTPTPISLDPEPQESPSTFDADAARKQCRVYQKKLRQLAYQLYVQRRTLLIVYEGWDAGGSNSLLHHVTARLDPRSYEVFPITAAKGEDAMHHYLWRFWRRLRPADNKQVLIFNHSWYGRVMVKRIQGFCSDREWKRAAREINEFEWQLADFGIILAKFWIRVTPEEQLHRFQINHDVPYKAWDLPSQSWMQQETWQQYTDVVEDILRRTSTEKAPWHVIEGDSVEQMHVEGLGQLVTLLSATLNYDPVVRKKKRKKGKKKSKRKH